MTSANRWYACPQPPRPPLSLVLSPHRPPTGVARAASRTIRQLLGSVGAASDAACNRSRRPAAAAMSVLSCSRRAYFQPGSAARGVKCLFWPARRSVTRYARIWRLEGGQHRRPNGARVGLSSPPGLNPAAARRAGSCGGWWGN